MEAAEKEVAVKISAGWLKAACRTRATKGRTNGQFLLISRDRPPLPPPGHILGSFGQEGTDEDMIRGSATQVRLGVCRISDFRPYTT